MMNKKLLGVLTTVSFFSGALLFAQVKGIDREKEREKFKSLYVSEKIQERNILQTFQHLSEFGYFVSFSQQDRAKAIKGEIEPHNFRHDHRLIKYVPWRNSVRYVKEGPQFVFNTFGDTKEINSLIQNESKRARSYKINIPDLKIANRDGVELMVFGFIYAKDPDKTRAIGSRRKWLTLYFTPAGVGKLNEATYKLEMATLRLVHHDFRRNQKEVEMIIDPTPLDEAMDDIIIIHRSNQAPADVFVVGLMHNTESFAHRFDFKFKYYAHLHNNFLQLFERVAKYNQFSSSEAHEKEIERLDRGLDY